MVIAIGSMLDRFIDRWLRWQDQSHDIELQRRLWAVSEELTGVIYPVG
jgi:hypothetical protein